MVHVHVLLSMGSLGQSNLVPTLVVAGPCCILLVPVLYYVHYCLSVLCHLGFVYPSVYCNWPSLVAGLPWTLVGFVSLLCVWCGWTLVEHTQHPQGFVDPLCCWCMCYSLEYATCPLVCHSLSYPLGLLESGWQCFLINRLRYCLLLTFFSFSTLLSCWDVIFSMLLKCVLTHCIMTGLNSMSSILIASWLLLSFSSSSSFEPVAAKRKSKIYFMYLLTCLEAAWTWKKSSMEDWNDATAIQGCPLFMNSSTKNVGSGMIFDTCTTVYSSTSCNTIFESVTFMIALISGWGHSCASSKMLYLSSLTIFRNICFSVVSPQKAIVSPLFLLE